MRILPTLGAGGTERQCLEVVEYIRSGKLETPAGHLLQIDLATIYGPPAAHTLRVPKGVNILHLNKPRNNLGLMRAARRLRAVLRGYDCAHALLWPAVWATAAAMPRIPWIASLHGSQIRTDLVGFKLLLDRLAFRRATAVVFNSQAGRDALLNRLAIPGYKASIIQNGKSVLPDPQAERSGLVCLARFLPPKRHGLLLDAMAQLKPATRPELLIYGLGTDSPELRDEIARRRLAPGVQALGETETPLEAAAAAELLVLPSDHEGAPNAILEAWAAGTPVLASNVSGINQLVKHGADGWLVDNKAELWAAAITRLLDDHELRARLAANGRLRLEQHYSMQACAEGWAGMYEKLTALR